LQNEIIKPAENTQLTAKQLLELLEEVLDDNKAEDVVSIDLEGKSSVADYLLIATGRSARHVSAIADYVLRAAKAAGLKFEVLELTMQTLTPQNIARQHALITDSDGPVLAYCRTGTRCSVVWALTQAGEMTTDDILAATTAAGYELSDLAPTLDQMSQAR